MLTATLVVCDSGGGGSSSGRFSDDAYAPGKVTISVASVKQFDVSRDAPAQALGTISYSIHLQKADGTGYEALESGIISTTATLSINIALWLLTNPSLIVTAHHTNLRFNPSHYGHRHHQPTNWLYQSQQYRCT